MRCCNSHFSSISCDASFVCQGDRFILSLRECRTLLCTSHCGRLHVLFSYINNNGQVRRKRHTIISAISIFPSKAAKTPMETFGFRFSFSAYQPVNLATSTKIVISVLASSSFKSKKPFLSPYLLPHIPTWPILRSLECSDLKWISSSIHHSLLKSSFNVSERREIGGETTSEIDTPWMVAEAYLKLTTLCHRQTWDF